MSRICILTTVQNGEIYTSLHPSREVAIQALDAYIKDEWDENLRGPYEVFSRDQTRELWGDDTGGEWSIQEHALDSPNISQEVYLTPGMCALVRYATQTMSFKRAKQILLEHKEIGNQPDEETAKVIDNIAQQLE